MSIFHAFPITLSLMAFHVLNFQTSQNKIKDKINVELAKQKGVFAVAFKNLQSGEELLINERLNFHAASLMKTPVMIETYQQAAAGKFFLSEPIIIKNSFNSIADGSPYSLDPKDDSELELYSKIGTKLPVYELLYLMIIKSSNLATNIIIELVGADNVTKSMRKLGANHTQVLRGVEDGKAYRKGLNNTTTAYDQMLIFAGMAQGKIVSKKSSDAMIKILLDQAFNNKIPAKIPKEVKVAHKTGWITGINHDAGIVYLPDGRKYVLVLLSKELEDDKAAINAMANVSKIIYDYVNGQGISD